MDRKIISNFKIAIFDLDGTLWDCKKIFDDVIEILQSLKNNGIKIYIASYNLEADICCDKLSIKAYTDGIFFGQCISKIGMVKIIMEKNKGIKSEDIIYFDDDANNITNVNKFTGVNAQLINRNGLSWECISNIY